MREELNPLPAAIFYLAHTAGLISLISYPALKSATSVILPAAILGAMGYGIYELTSYAVMKNWSLTMVATGLTRGTILTAFSAWAGLAITRAVTQM